MLKGKAVHSCRSQGRQLANHKHTEKLEVLLRCEYHGTQCLTRMVLKHTSCTALTSGLWLATRLTTSHQPAYSFSSF